MRNVVNVLRQLIFVFIFILSYDGWARRRGESSDTGPIKSEKFSAFGSRINRGNRKAIEVYNARLAEQERETFWTSLQSPTVIFFSLLTIVGLFLLRWRRKAGLGGNLALEMAMVKMERERLQKYADELNQQVAESSCQETLDDEAFNNKELNAHFTNLFLQLMETLSCGKIEKLRPYMTEGLYQQFFFNHKIYDLAGLHYSLSDIKVHSNVMCELKSDAVFNQISIDFSISGVEQFLNLSEAVSYGSKKPKQKKVNWQFIRKKGVKTASHALFSGKCPSCLQKIKLTVNGKCDSCSVDFRQGDYDWILNQTTPHLPYLAPHLLNSEEVDLSDLQAKDINFSILSLFNKLTHVFWALRYSEFEHDFRFVRQFLTTELLRSISGDRCAYKWKTTVDAMVVKWDVIEYNPATDDEFDRLMVKIIWYGREIVRESGENVLPNLADLQLIRQTFTLKRHKDCLTQKHQVMHSCYCPECGHQLSAKNDKECEKCHINLVDGQADWVVESIEKFRRKYKAPIVPDYREKIPYYSERFTISENKLIAVIQVMLIDGVEECEQQMLEAIAKKLELSDERLLELIDVVKNEEVIISEPISIKDSEELLILVITMAFSNGDLSMSERELIHSFARKLGFQTEADITRLFRKAKLELREQVTERGQDE